MKVQSMITAAAVVAVGFLVACSSSSSGSGGSIQSCKGGTQSTGQGSAACTTCLQGSCGSQLSAAESGCSDYFNCFGGCNCSDLTCIEGCLSKATASSCQTPFMSLGSCISSSCASECNTTTPGDAG